MAVPSGGSHHHHQRHPPSPAARSRLSVPSARGAHASPTPGSRKGRPHHSSSGSYDASQHGGGGREDVNDSLPFAKRTRGGGGGGGGDLLRHGTPGSPVSRAKRGRGRRTPDGSHLELLEASSHGELSLNEREDLGLSVYEPSGGRPGGLSSPLLQPSEAGGSDNKSSAGSRSSRSSAHAAEEEIREGVARGGARGMRSTSGKRRLSPRGGGGAGDSLAQHHHHHQHLHREGEGDEGKEEQQQHDRQSSRVVHSPVLSPSPYRERGGGGGGRRSPGSAGLSPVPTGVYFDASRKLWRCQWRENGRFKTKGFSLNVYKNLKEARRACVLYRCMMGGWEVDPRWLEPDDEPQEEQHHHDESATGEIVITHGAEEKEVKKNERENVTETKDDPYHEEPNSHHPESHGSSTSSSSGSSSAQLTAEEG